MSKRNLADLVKSVYIEENSKVSPGPVVAFTTRDLRTGREEITERTDFPDDYNVTLAIRVKSQSAEYRADTDRLMRDVLGYFKQEVQGFKRIVHPSENVYVLERRERSEGYVSARYLGGRNFRVYSSGYIHSVNLFVAYAMNVLGRRRIEVIQKINGKEIGKHFRYAPRKKRK